MHQSVLQLETIRVSEIISFILRGRLTHPNIFPNNNEHELSEYISQAIDEEAILVCGNPFVGITGVIVGKCYRDKRNYYIAGLYATRVSALVSFAKWMLSSDTADFTLDARRHGKVVHYSNAGKFLNTIIRIYGRRIK